MRLLGFQRFLFVGSMYLPLEDPTSSQGTAVITYVKDVAFNFTDDPNAPRQELVASEPFPVAARIANIRDRYGVQPLPGSEWTITSIEPVINVFGGREVYRHQAALFEPPDFGYDGIVRG